MFAVIFEVHPRPEHWDAYLAIAGGLRPKLERVEGFVDNLRYRSLTRPGWLLSLSSWRDEKALVRWRSEASHHEAQTRGRGGIFQDYHLRIGEITHDSRLPPGMALPNARLDVTETGAATTAMLIDASWPEGEIGPAGAEKVAASLGLDPDAPGLVAWDVLEAVLTPGDAILLLSWRTPEAAEAFAAGARLPEAARLRQVRIIRDYGMFDRREAPQFHR